MDVYYNQKAQVVLTLHNTWIEIESFVFSKETSVTVTPFSGN
jgi:hypothetical protein